MGGVSISPFVHRPDLLHPKTHMDPGDMGESDQVHVSFTARLIRGVVPVCLVLAEVRF